jgi:hypothetical protein
MGRKIFHSILSLSMAESAGLLYMLLSDKQQNEKKKD